MTQARITAVQLAGRYDLMARPMLVTGADSDIGLELVRALAHADATVIAGVSDPAARPSIEAIQGEIEGTTIELVPLDLADLQSVRRFVLNFHGSARPLSAIFNLAVPYPTAQRRLTVDGFERQFGVSHLGHHTLTTGLVGALLRASDARVVNVTNAAHQAAEVDLTRLAGTGPGYDPWQAYAQSRSAAGLFTSGLHQHHAAEGLCAALVHLGGADPTEYQNSTPELVRELGWASVDGVVGPPVATAAELAADVLWAGVAAELDGLSGHVVQHQQLLEPGQYPPRLMDPGMALALWEVSERLTRPS